MRRPHATDDDFIAHRKGTVMLHLVFRFGDRPWRDVEADPSFIARFDQLLRLSFEDLDEDERIVATLRLFRRMLSFPYNDHYLIDLLRLAQALLPVSAEHRSTVRDQVYAVLKEKQMTNETTLLSAIEQLAEERGEAHGRTLGARLIVLSLLHQRFAELNDADRAAVDELELPALVKLTERLDNFQSSNELRYWLNREAPRYT